MEKREKLMKKMGQILANKPSKKKIRKHQRRMQHLRCGMRAAQARVEELIAEQMERDKVLREYEGETGEV